MKPLELQIEDRAAELMAAYPNRIQMARILAHAELKRITELSAANAQLAEMKREARDIANFMHGSVLPDPHDEREISLEWLKTKVGVWEKRLRAAIMAQMTKFEFETHCPSGQKCGATTTGCPVGQCLLRNVMSSTMDQTEQKR